MKVILLGGDHLILRGGGGNWQIWSGQSIYFRQDLGRKINLFSSITKARIFIVIINKILGKQKKKKKEKKKNPKNQGGGGGMLVQTGGRTGFSM